VQSKYVKKAFRRLLLQVGGALLSVAVLSYCGYHLWRSMTSSVTTETALPVTVESVVPSTGYLFREERLLYAEAASAGSVTSVLSSGAKVAVGGTVARIYDVHAPDVVDRLAEIEEQILLLEDSLEGSLSLKDISGLDDDIQSQISTIHYASLTGDYSAVASARRALLTSINKRGIITGTSADLEDAIASLRLEATKLTATLGVCRETVTAPVGGYYYPAADGYESLFTPEALSEITTDGFDRLTGAKPVTVSEDCVGKLATSYTWRVACSVDRETAEGLKAGSVYTVAFPYSHGERVQMELEKAVYTDEDTTAVLVFKTSRMPEGFTYARSQPVEIVEREYVGFRIPIDAVRIINGREGVYILDGSKVRFRYISVLATVDDAYIAAENPKGDGGEYGWLKRNDVVILSGKGLYDGRILT